MPRLIPEYSVWFDVPDDPCQGRVEIRYIQDGETQDIVNQAIDARWVFTDDGAVQESRHDLQKDNNLVLCRSVKSWENFLDENGKPLPCTDDNKLRYAREGWFRKFVLEKRKLVAETFAASQEAKRKNSSALPSGSPA